MPGTYRAIEAILMLLQLIPIVVLSVGSFRMKRWLAPSLREVRVERRGVENSVLIKTRTGQAVRSRPRSTKNRK